jgi:hypothetical protein
VRCGAVGSGDARMRSAVHWSGVALICAREVGLGMGMGMALDVGGGWGGSKCMESGGSFARHPIDLLRAATVTLMLDGTM